MKPSSTLQRENTIMYNGKPSVRRQNIRKIIISHVQIYTKEYHDLVDVKAFVKPG